MSCALPCTWWCCMIEPVWAPPRKLRTKSLSYVCSAYSASQSFVLFYLWYSSCFNVKCWFHTFQAVFSYFYGSTNPSWSLRLSCQLFSNRCASLQVDPNISTFARSILSFLNGIHSICPKLPLFSRPPTLFLQGLIYVNQVSIYSCEVSSLFSINVLIRWFPKEDAQQF